jgi:ATP-dependent RNA helicase SUPV3L1/SUV3
MTIIQTLQPRSLSLSLSIFSLYFLSIFQVLVATDAVGMGLNLNIRRLIFYSMTKMQLTEDGDKEISTISVSQALQIAGRAGRFNTQWETGYVTTFKQAEIKVRRNE